VTLRKIALEDIDHANALLMFCNHPIKLEEQRKNESLENPVLTPDNWLVVHCSMMKFESQRVYPQPYPKFNCSPVLT
jgi:hypothetical protein